MNDVSVCDLLWSYLRRFGNGVFLFLLWGWKVIVCQFGGTGRVNLGQGFSLGVHDRHWKLLNVFEPWHLIRFEWNCGWF